MGTFGNSFSRELGRNTGKVVSNAVFGDKWSTPHRITSTVKIAQIKAQQSKLEAEALKEKAEIEYDLQINKIKLEQKFEKEKNEAKLLEDIIKTSFTNDSNNNYQVLTELWSLVQSHKSESIKKATISKIEDGIFKMKQIGSIDEANFFSQRLNNYNESIVKEKNIKKKKLIFQIVGGVILFIIVVVFYIKMMKFIKNLF